MNEHTLVTYESILEAMTLDVHALAALRRGDTFAALADLTNARTILESVRDSLILQLLGRRAIERDGDFFEGADNYELTSR